MALDSEGPLKDEETFKGPGEFIRENVAFLTTRHESKSTLHLSELDEREFQFELDNYFEELSNLDEHDLSLPWGLENEDQPDLIEQQWPKLYEDIIRNADFAIGGAMSINLQMRTQWFKDLNRSTKLAVKADKAVPARAISSRTPAQILGFVVLRTFLTKENKNIWHIWLFLKKACQNQNKITQPLTSKQRKAPNPKIWAGVLEKIPLLLSGQI